MPRVLQPFKYSEPRTIKEAVQLLSSENAKVLAGGTDLLVTMKRKAIAPQHILDIKGIGELNCIDYRPGEGLKIGALATLQSIADSPAIREKYTLLANACGKVCTPQVRNMGTIGGNLCQDTRCAYYARIGLLAKEPCHRAGGNLCYAVRGAKICPAMAAPETAPVLMCLGAEVCIFGINGDRTIPVEDFFVSSGVVNLKANEIVTAIKIPEPVPQTSGAYIRESFRQAADFAIAGVAVVLSIGDGLWHNARMGLLGVAPSPLRAYGAEEMLNGKIIDDGVIEEAAQAVAKAAHPLGDVFATANYRRKLVKVLAKRAIRQVIDSTVKLEES